MMSAEEARNIQYNIEVEKNKKELLEIEEQIKKQIKKESCFSFIVTREISYISSKILKNLGYRVQQRYDPKEGQIYYIISW